MFKGYIFDIDGTVIQNERLIPGAREVFEELDHRKIPYVFVTNTTSKTAVELHSILIDAGLNIFIRQIINPVVVLRDYLLEKKVARIAIEYCKSQEPVFHDFNISNNPEVVIIADDGNGLSYRSINRVFNYILKGAEPVTLQRNKFYALDGKLVVDLGFYVAGFEYITGKKIRNFGKPSPDIVSYAKKLLNISESAAIAMVGDDIEFDILAMQQHGLYGILVQTGKYRPEEEKQFIEKPDRIIPSIANVFKE